MKYFLIALLFAFPAFAQETAKPPEVRAYTGMTTPNKTKDTNAVKLRQPNVEIWLPPQFQASEEKWPLLIFSHGFGGCARQSEFLTSYLADQGYIVIAPDHEDAKCAGASSAGSIGRLSQRRGGTRDWPERPFRNPEQWTDKTEADRREDVLFAVSSMLDDRKYKNYIDTDRMGLIGHSLGGYTMLGIAGGWSAWKDARFKAVVALSPFLTPYMKNGGLRRIGIPVMYQGGTKDTPITPEISRKGGAYAQTPAPKYFIELDGANHFAWTELDRGYQDIIRRTVLAFTDKYVKGKDSVIDEAKKPKIRIFWKDEAAQAQTAPARK